MKKKELEERKVPDNWIHFIEKAIGAAESTVQNAMKTRRLLEDSALPNSSADHADALDSLCEKVTDAIEPLKRWLRLGKISTGQTPHTIRSSVAAAVSSTKHLNDEVVVSQALCKYRR